MARSRSSDPGSRRFSADSSSCFLVAARDRAAGSSSRCANPLEPRYRVGAPGLARAQLNLVTDPDGDGAARGDPLVKATVTKRAGPHMRIRPPAREACNLFSAGGFAVSGA